MNHVKMFAKLCLYSTLTTIFAVSAVQTALNHTAILNDALSKCSHK